MVVDVMFWVKCVCAVMFCGIFQKGIFSVRARTDALITKMQDSDDAA